MWRGSLVLRDGRLCCVKIQLLQDTIVGVYLPSNGYSEEYQSCLTDLEELLSTSHFMK